jgi:hypothetical protein
MDTVHVVNSMWAFLQGELVAAQVSTSLNTKLAGLASSIVSDVDNFGVPCRNPAFISSVSSLSSRHANKVCGQPNSIN